MHGRATEKIETIVVGIRNHLLLPREVQVVVQNTPCPIPAVAYFYRRRELLIGTSQPYSFYDIANDFALQAVC